MYPTCHVKFTLEMQWSVYALRVAQHCKVELHLVVVPLDKPTTDVNLLKSQPSILHTEHFLLMYCSTMVDRTRQCVLKEHLPAQQWDFHHHHHV